MTKQATGTAVQPIDRKQPYFQKMMSTLDGHIRKCAAVEVGRQVVYAELCRYIRTEKVPDDLVRERMFEAGFHKVRVSEVLKICSAPDDIWQGYLSGQLGYRRALQLARYSADDKIAASTVAGQEYAKTMGVPPTEEKLVIDVLEKEEASAKSAAAFTEEQNAANRKPVTDASKCERAAQIIFKNSTQSRSWNSGDGWRLTLVRVKLPGTSAVDNRPGTVAAGKAGAK